MASFWKRYPPGWFAFESDGWWGDDDDDDDDGDGGGGGEEDDGGEEGDGGDDEGDGDGGVDFSWSGGDDDDDDDFGGGEDFGGGGGGGGGDDDDDNFNRSIEREQRRQRQQAEEDQRQRELDDQNRQIEEQRQRMAEEQNLGQDANADGIPDTGMLTETAQSPTGAAIQENVQGQLADLQEQTQAQNALFDPKSPDWIYQTGGSYKPPAIFRPPPPVTDEEPQTAFTPGPSGSLLDVNATSGKTPREATTSQRAFGPIDRETVPDNVRVPEIAAIAAAKAAADAGGTPEVIAQTAEHAARIASDRQTLAQQSAWTRAAFRSQYGDRADQEWARQHEAELARNRSLYGTSEPRAGAAPVASAPAGTALAPDRRIGQTPPPGPGQEARYGINSVAPTALAAPASARTASPGATTPTAQGPQAVAPIRPGGTTSANTLIQPTDQVLVEDATSGIQRWVRGSDLPQYTRDVGPGVKSPWQVKNVRPAGDQGPLGVSDTSNPDVNIGTPPRPVSAPSILRAVPPTAAPPTLPGQMSHSPAPESIRGTTEGPSRERGALPPSTGISNAIEPLTADPDDRRIYDEGAHESDNLPGTVIPPGLRTQGPEGVQQARNIVEYNPATGQTEEPRFTPERNIVGYNPDTGETYELPATRRMASTDTALTPGMGASEPAYRDPVLASVQTSRPLSALASLAATTRGPDYDPAQDAFHIAHGISAMLNGERDAQGKYVTWAEPYLNDVARMAYAREEAAQGRPVDPRQAPVDYIEKWKDAFYGSDTNVPLVKELDQEMIDFAARRSPPSGPFNWKDAFGPNGEKGLISQQVTGVDCGPNAFSTLMRSQGYNVDPRTAFNFAVQRGYHSGNQFNGPEAMVNMVQNELGMSARTVRLDDAGWAAVDKELAEGRVAMLSGPDHWWAVSAKNERGQYYVGATGLSAAKLTGGWLPRGGIVYITPPNTAVLSSGQVDPNARAVKAMGADPPKLGPGNTRPLLSGQTQYETPGQRATTRLSQEMQAPSSPDVRADSPPSPRANLKDRFTVGETEDMRDRILKEMPDIQFDPNDGVETRMEKIRPALEWLEKEYGFSAEDLAGMAYNENHLGMANSGAVRGNNLWSVQYMPSDSQAVGPIPEGRWAKYPSIKHALARFVGMYAHPENGYQYTWQNRKDPDKLLDALIRDKYVVTEPGPGNSVEEWRAGVGRGRELWRRVKANQVTTRENPSIGRGQ